ncbi:MAG: NupC/NupG family nucleoside CNT transporter [Planctomycetota bacterium]
MYRLLSFLGIFVFVGLCYVLSTHRSRVRWKTVLVGLLAQFALGLLVLYWKPGNAALQDLGKGVARFLALSDEGGGFIFGVLAKPGEVGRVFGSEQAFLFAFQVLPTIIFFSAFMAVLYHLGVMQLVVKGLAWLMVRLMRTSGSESLSVAGNIFVGQTEAPLLVRPFLDKMTQSELMTVMTGGFATIAGGVFALYVGFGIDPGHLIVASVMSAPAAIVVAKLLVPETEESETMGTVSMAMEKSSGNVVEATANGAIDGLKLAMNVAAMLIAFLGLVAVINWLLGMLSEDLSLQIILGWIFSPLAFCLGVEWGDVPRVGELLGTKIAVTELIAYKSLAGMTQDGVLSERSVTISTYALCGFANLGSIGIQIGGISALAPGRRSDLARLGVRAMMGGAFASWMTAAVAGILV